MTTVLGPTTLAKSRSRFRTPPRSPSGPVLTAAVRSRAVATPRCSAREAGGSLSSERTNRNRRDETPASPTSTGLPGDGARSAIRRQGSPIVDVHVATSTSRATPEISVWPESPPESVDPGGPVTPTWHWCRPSSSGDVGSRVAPRHGRSAAHPMSGSSTSPLPGGMVVSRTDSTTTGTEKTVLLNNEQKALPVLPSSLMPPRMIRPGGAGGPPLSEPVPPAVGLLPVVCSPASLLPAPLTSRTRQGHSDHENDGAHGDDRDQPPAKRHDGPCGSAIDHRTGYDQWIAAFYRHMDACSRPGRVGKGYKHPCGGTLGRQVNCAKISSITEIASVACRRR